MLKDSENSPAPIAQSIFFADDFVTFLTKRMDEHLQ